MEEKMTEEQELIPGTNIPRPRYRGVYETDEEYVEYLKNYYGEYFPELSKEEVSVTAEPVEPIITESTDIDVMNAEISEAEIEQIQNNLENYAESIKEEVNESSEKITEPVETVIENTTTEADTVDFSFDTSPVPEEFSFDTSQVPAEFSFDTSQVPVENSIESSDIGEIEIEGFTESNSTLKAKAKSPNLLSKVSAFFKDLKVKVIDLYKEASDIVLEDNVAIAGRTR